MRILAIDPGNEQSAFVFYVNGEVIEHRILRNDMMLLKFGEFRPRLLMAIEMVASYGMPVGKDVFETCVWIGRFIQKWGPEHSHKVYRTDVKMHLCHTARAKDSNVRQALIDLYPATGGGKCPQIGIKSKPGPLYGVSKDVWSALAVAVTFEASVEQALQSHAHEPE